MIRPSLTSMITRAKVITSRIAGRTLLQVTGLDQETFSNVELLLPPGYVARPPAGADLLLLQANGVRDHRVAVAGDAITDTLADLAHGEIGLSRNGRRVILRQGYVEIVDPVEIRLVAPTLVWSPDGTTFYKLATDQHVHGGVQAGGAETAAPVATSPGVT